MTKPLALKGVEVQPNQIKNMEPAKGKDSCGRTIKVLEKVGNWGGISVASLAAITAIAIAIFAFVAVPSAVFTVIAITGALFSATALTMMLATSTLKCSFWKKMNIPSEEDVVEAIVDKALELDENNVEDTEADLDVEKNKKDEKLKSDYLLIQEEAKKAKEEVRKAKEDLEKKEQENKKLQVENSELRGKNTLREPNEGNSNSGSVEDEFETM